MSALSDVRVWVVLRPDGALLPYWKDNEVSSKWVMVDDWRLNTGKRPNISGYEQIERAFADGWCVVECRLVLVTAEPLRCDAADA